jgi:hypothetical protein
MAIQRITISVPAETAARIKKAAGKRPVSSWITSVIEDRLEDADLDRLFDEFYKDVAPSKAAIRRADAIFEAVKRGPRRKKRVA